MALGYFINRKKTTCVVTLTGSFTPQDAEVLNQCKTEIISQETLYIIINMGGINSMEPDVFRIFTLFQHELRERAKLMLCDIFPKAEMLMKSGGVIRDSEIFPDLVSALQEILNMERG